MPTARRDFSRARIRTRIEAAILRHSPEHPAVEARKREVIGAMRGTVVELGPGPGTNMPYYADDVQLVAVEPNPGMHPHLREAAAAHDVDIDIRTIHGEDVAVEDHSADAVVGTLLLCGVDDPDQVLAQVRRILRPGGTYFFFEHVVGPPGSLLRGVQKVVKAPHRWFANGCEVDRDTATTLRRAGFADLDLAELDGGLGMGWTRAWILGTATA